MLNRGDYPNVEKYNMHIAAYDRLDQAIEFEEKGEMGKARMSLILACKLELQALGFESTGKDLMKTVHPWNKPALVTVH